MQSLCGPHGVTKIQTPRLQRVVDLLHRIDIAAGAAFVLLCSAAGKSGSLSISVRSQRSSTLSEISRLMSWGDNSKGQLGVGHLQESHEPLEPEAPGSAVFCVAHMFAHCLHLANFQHLPTGVPGYRG